MLGKIIDGLLLGECDNMKTFWFKVRAEKDTSDTVGQDLPVFITRETVSRVTAYCTTLNDAEALADTLTAEGYDWTVIETL
jgi:hypothetical protein